MSKKYSLSSFVSWIYLGNFLENQHFPPTFLPRCLIHSRDSLMLGRTVPRWFFNQGKSSLNRQLYSWFKPRKATILWQRNTSKLIFSFSGQKGHMSEKYNPRNNWRIRLSKTKCAWKTSAYTAKISVGNCGRLFNRKVGWW